MASKDQKLLIVEDDPGLQDQLKWCFEEFSPFIAGDRKQALEYLRQEKPQVMITDLGLPPDPGGSSEGFALLEEAVASDQDVKVIVVTGREEKSNAVKAIGLGAYDFYQKPIDVDTLKLVVERAFRLIELELENLRLSKAQAVAVQDGLIGNCPPMQEILRTVERIAPASVSVLILGETGTGKGELAKLLHSKSDRSEDRFVTINCASIPEALLESELFGHEKGAFTGAVGKKIGKFEYATGGTLFLDEIGDMPLPLQAKLLHVLQEKKITRLGGNQEVDVDVRIICATHQNIKDQIEQGQFREDLYYRVSEISVVVPPLRDRGEDLNLLALSFLTKYAKQQSRKVNAISKDALRALHLHNWPGNIRELENRVKRAVVMAEKPVIGLKELDMEGIGESYVPRPLKEVRAEAETAAITQALMSSSSISDAAKSLGVTRPTLYNLIHKYDLETHLVGKQDQDSLQET